MRGLVRPRVQERTWLEPGDVVTIDTTLNAAYAGLYEIMQEVSTLAGSASAAGLRRTPVAGGLSLTLRAYSDGNFPDVVPDSEPGWPTVPGLPGGNVSATILPLDDGGEAAIYTGSGADGDSFQMPSGFTSTNKLCWASPQGFIEGDGHLHYVQDCDAYDSRKLALIYNDGSGLSWRGDVNYLVVTWRARTSARTFSPQAMSYVELTLLGGEKVVFGKGIVPGGQQVPLPAGYPPSQPLPLGFPKAAVEHGQPSCGIASWVNPGGIVHCLYDNGHGTQFEGDSQAFVCAFQNNGGSWRKHANGWYHCTLGDGRVLAVATHLVADQQRAIQADVSCPVIYSQAQPPRSHRYHRWTG